MKTNGSFVLRNRGDRSGDGSMPFRLLISGGGTGGHVYPALAMAEYMQKAYEMDILFVGSAKKMEAQIVPKAGYAFVGLPILAWPRGGVWQRATKLLAFAFALLTSTYLAFRLLRRFRPHAVLGTGGYASFPCVYLATFMKTPTVIHEPNAHAGLVHRCVAKRITYASVSHAHMGRYFDKNKLLLSGTPLRLSLYQLPTQETARKALGLALNRPVLLVLGGSLGAKRINECILNGFTDLIKEVQLLWICGEGYFKNTQKAISAIFDKMNKKPNDWGCLLPFTEDMDKAYAAATLAVCRAGALCLAELKVVQLPALLVPSPHVVEGHQKINAQAFADLGFANCIDDDEANEKLVPNIHSLLANNNQMNAMKQALKGAVKVRPEKILGECLASLMGVQKKKEDEVYAGNEDYEDDKK